MSDHNTFFQASEWTNRTNSSTVTMSTYSSPVVSYEKGRITASVGLDGKIVTATIDTETPRSFISKELAEDVWTQENKISTKALVCLADGYQTPITEALIMTVSMGTSKSVIELLILPGAIDPLILGLDFLNSVNSKLTIGEHTVSLCHSNMVASEHAPPVLKDQLLPTEKWPDIVLTSVADCLRRKNSRKRISFMIKMEDVRYRVRISRSGIAKVFIMSPKNEGDMIVK